MICPYQHICLLETNTYTYIHTHFGVQNCHGYLHLHSWVLGQFMFHPMWSKVNGWKWCQSHRPLWLHMVGTFMHDQPGRQKKIWNTDEQNLRWISLGKLRYKICVLYMYMTWFYFWFIYIFSSIWAFIFLPLVSSFVYQQARSVSGARNMQRKRLAEYTGNMWMYKWWIFRWNVTLPEGKVDSLHVSSKTRHKLQALFSGMFESIYSQNNIRLEQKLGLNQQWDLYSHQGIKLQDALALAPRITELFIFVPPSWKWKMVTFKFPPSGSL